MFEDAIGKYSKFTIIHPETREILVNAGSLITNEVFELLVDAGADYIETLD